MRRWPPRSCALLVAPVDERRTELSFPDSLISRSQCLAGAIERGSPSVADLQGLLTDIPPDASTPARFIARQVFMRVFSRFASTLDAGRDAVSFRAFVTWSGADASSAHWRDELFDLVGVWSAQRTTHDDATPVVGGVADLRIRGALETLDQRYSEPGLALRDVAFAANLSICQTARLLKRHTGLGFVAHLHQRRIAAARVQLTETTLSIKEIADRVGYPSASELGRHFRRSTGMTPREYRRAHAFTGGTRRAKSHHE
jgi:AraC-like DNA-binding protein